MHARDSDALFGAPTKKVNVAVLRERLVILRDLIAFRQIRIEIVFSSEPGEGIDLAMQGNRRADGELHCLPAQDGQGTR